MHDKRYMIMLWVMDAGAGDTQQICIQKFNKLLIFGKNK